MSRKTNIPRKIVLGDRGIQTYRSCDKGFADSLRTTTFKEVKDSGDARIIRESEFAKPYGEQYEDPWEDYSAMEYGAPDLPPWGWDYPGMEDPASRWRVTFFCDIDPCWQDGETRVFNAKCGWDLIGVEFDPPEDDFSVTFSGTTVSITAVAGASGTGALTLTMRARFKIGKDQHKTVIGTHSGISVSECTDTTLFCDDSAMAWDKNLSADTIVQNGNVSVYITDSLGKGGPYSWAVTGTDFSLDNAVTTGLSNVLRAGPTACGSAVIVVTGCDGSTVVDAVRCTSSGTWASCATFDYRGYGGGSCTAADTLCAAGRFRYRRNAAAGIFYQGCGSGGHTCNQQVNCTGSNYTSVAELAADPRSGCTYHGETCHDNNTYIWFEYWKCP